MIVCSCNVISHTTLLSALHEQGTSVTTPLQAYRCLGHSPKCGRCLPAVSRLIEDVRTGGCPADCGACVAKPETLAVLAAE